MNLLPVQTLSKIDKNEKKSEGTKAEMFISLICFSFLKLKTLSQPY